MSGWIDPLGVRALHRYVQAELYRLEALAEETARIRPQGRRLARYRARIGELGRMQAILQRVERSGLELKPFKELVNQHSDRHARIEAVDGVFRAYLQRREAAP